jgi:hypothetical protein
MANQLDMRKSLAIRQLHQQGLSQREIAQTLGVSRGAVIRHLTQECSNSTKAPTGKVPTGSPDPNSTKVPTGSKSSEPSAEHVAEPTQESRTESSIAAESQLNARSRSRCASFHQIIIEKLDLGLDSHGPFVFALSIALGLRIWEIERETFAATTEKERGTYDRLGISRYRISHPRQTNDIRLSFLDLQRKIRARL